MARKSKSTTPPPERPEQIFNEPISEALSRRYLAYALSTITARALPDVRDGLKPVHRRILYAMRNMKLSPTGSYKKSAKVVGEVMGNFHPHGDQAIYDAMVRLVQDFSVRIPLVDGQGNFGNIDGDNAAAMRYTESRLTTAAEMLLNGIDEDTVDFRATYDGEDREPVVLPAAFPNLLANGSSGIAVGMATNIPPHNPAELIDAAIHLIKTPNARTETLLNYVSGPDLPTGGVCVEPQASILEAYATGRGGFRVRARWSQEDLGRGRYQIVITEIPYQVQKSRLIERIAELIQARKLPAITDIRDESAEDIRLILEPRAGNLDPHVVMESVFKVTDLETRIPLNMNVLDATGAPRVMSLRDCLQAFLDHRKEVLVRGTNFRLEKIARRLEILDGYIIAYLNLDEVIRIIRYEDHPKAELIKAFKLTDNQAEAILNMRLRSLRKLEEMELRREHSELLEEQAALQKLLGSDELQWSKLTEQLRETKKAFDPKSDLGRRRTSMEDAPEGVEVDLEDLIEKEPVTIVISQKGWVRALKGHVEDLSAVKYKEGDKERFAIRGQTTDKLMLFATNGKFYTLDVKDLPGGRGHGEPVRLMIDLGNEHDLARAFIYKGERMLIVASSAGHGLFVKEEDALATTKKGKQVLNPAAGAEAQVCRIIDGEPGAGDMIAAVGTNRKLLIFPADEMPTMTRGKGVALQKFSSGSLADAKLLKASDGLTWVDRAGRVQSEPAWKDWAGKRAQAGKTVPKGFPRSGDFGPDSD
ncbi:DNA topoisomerase IV subunit A [Parvularcula sp. LCG005]|uniref:DNA topoisomerase IV subunit A n=1 Tax=Parvularcula sp. LCG005 TaxID=3078805 RepID=UPI0029432B6A|nr:DNA topoisomerase IV subunit A [Parvularcula sp. LCG005]WOI52329.1 DNA topoisomerase IV subunit A [Parvularcula sp. LCG005]